MNFFRGFLIGVGALSVAVIGCGIDEWLGNAILKRPGLRWPVTGLILVSGGTFLVFLGFWVGSGS